MAQNPLLTTETKLFGVFGHPVSHSLSPAFQNAGLQAMDVPGVYLAFDVEPVALGTSLQTLAGWRAGGVNLTIPLKEKAFELLDHLADSASFAGSVNTVAFDEKGNMTGHSTDGAGLHHGLNEAFGEAFENRRVLILGCGGAGRAAALQAARDGAEQVVLANRTRSRAEAVESEIRGRLPGVDVSTVSFWPPAPEETRVADVIIQSTSVGMQDLQETGFLPDHFREGQVLLDMIYTQPVTPMMHIANTAGAQTANGLGMLLHQGVESLRIWTGREPPVEIMRQALQQAVEERRPHHVG